MGMSHQAGQGGRRRRNLATTRRLQGQRGASLVIALVLMLVLGVVLAAVLAFVKTNYKATEAYRQQRVQRYAGDAAMESAINYVRGKSTMGRDPLYSTSDPPCIYQVPTDAGTVYVSCKADEGSNSGVPNETGLVPNQAILAMGQRHNEVGPLNSTDCATILGLREHNEETEPSILFRRGDVKGYFEEGSLIPCDQRNRNLGQVLVRGKVVAAGQIRGNGSLVAAPVLVGTTSTPSVIEAEYGCTLPVSPSCLTGNNVPDSDWADPGNGGTTTAWQNVPINWSSLTTMGVTAPAIRNTGYHWDGSKLVATSSCGARDTIIFLPGVYTDANVLNRYTANGSCKESTIWLAPEPGADGILLTDDDKTGAFYFIFENGNTDWGCAGLNSLPHRWCIGGGAADQSPRVVTGTPDGWNPLGVPGAVTPRTVTMTTAQTIDSGLSQSWYNASGARTIGDGNYAYYRPTFCIFSLCISTNRSIRLRDFAPQVAQGPDASNNKIYVSIGHRELINTDTPTVELRTVSPESGDRTCPGTYTLPKNNTGSVRVDQLLYNGNAETAATQVAQCLDSADRINGLQITLRWTGNNFNSGYASPNPTIQLDGAQVSFQSTPGASFPIAGSGGPAAVIDCDKTKPGAQLIFGSDSHVYVPDGSLEVCAGPYPTNPGDHQQIALYGVPAVPDLRPTSVSAGSGTQFLNPSSYARKIAEPGGRQDLNIRYSTNSTCGFCTINFEGTANMAMPGYTPPSGLAVQRVDARVTYNSNNFCIFGWCPFGTASQLRVGSCSIDAPATSDERHWEANLYGGGRTCFNTGQLASGLTATWAARAKRICAFWICGSGSYTDQLDGVEFQVALQRANSSSQVLVPESNCITDYPNYWEGIGLADCAIAKADSLRPNNGFLSPILDEPADWIGRLSIQGTVYAPSAALEIDELDSAYALAARGLVLRHLRVKGFQNRPGYNLPVIDTQLDTRQQPREATFVACLNPAGTGSATECNPSAGNEDRILTKARVRFEAVQDPSVPGGWRPEVIWWNDQR